MKDTTPAPELPEIRTHDLTPTEHVPLDALPDGRIHVVKQVLAYLQNHADKNPNCKWFPFDLAGEIPNADRRIAESIVDLARAGLVKVIKVEWPENDWAGTFARII